MKALPEKIINGKVMLPVTFWGGHILTAVFYLVTTGSFGMMFLGTLLVGWFTSMVFGLVLLFAAYVLIFCAGIINLIAITLRYFSSARK